MKTLELFAGTQSFSKVAKKKGYNRVIGSYFLKFGKEENSQNTLIKKTNRSQAAVSRAINELLTNNYIKETKIENKSKFYKINVEKIIDYMLELIEGQFQITLNFLNEGEENNIIKEMKQLYSPIDVIRTPIFRKNIKKNEILHKIITTFFEGASNADFNHIENKELQDELNTIYGIAYFLIDNIGKSNYVRQQSYKLGDNVFDEFINVCSTITMRPEGTYIFYKTTTQAIDEIWRNTEQ